MMEKLTKVSETLYVPMMGRVYSSKYCPRFFYDEKALEIYEKLPMEVKDSLDGEEYTYIASAMRSKNVDRYVQNFLKDYPQGGVVNLGCGLESLQDRNDNGEATWFQLDLKSVLEIRKNYFPEKERCYDLPYSIFDLSWMEEVQKISQGPVLLIGAGLFHYFKEEQVVKFLNRLEGIAPAELVMDGVSSWGIKRSRKYMKKMGRKDASMYFSIDDPNDLIDQCEISIIFLREEKYYRHAGDQSQLQLSTRLKMKISDGFNMVKMLHFAVEG